MCDEILIRNIVKICSMNHRRFKIGSMVGTRIKWRPCSRNVSVPDNVRKIACEEFVSSPLPSSMIREVRTSSRTQAMLLCSKLCLCICVFETQWNRKQDQKNCKNIDVWNQSIRINRIRTCYHQIVHDGIVHRWCCCCWFCCLELYHYSFFPCSVFGGCYRMVVIISRLVSLPMVHNNILTNGRSHLGYHKW